MLSFRKKAGGDCAGFFGQASSTGGKSKDQRCTTMRQNKRKNKLLALFLTAFFLSASAGALSACSKNSDKTNVDQSEISSDSSSDSSKVKNGNFEFDSKKDNTPIVTSPKSWSLSSSLTSKTASGVIDTDADAWKKLTETGGNNPMTEAEAEAQWKSMNAYDRLNYIKRWKENNKNKKVDDLKFYKDHYNISFDDIPDADVNPGTHYAEGDAAANQKRVLMIHNTYSTGTHGTAQKYTSSSSVTLPAGTSATFSVWVKTAKLTYGTADNDAIEAAYNRGAYIGISQTVGGKSKDQVQVKNINTEKINESGANNGWVKYEFSLKGSKYASTTFTIVLGLGQGNSNSRFEFVDGYAFFDDIQCTVIDDTKYDELSAGAETVTDEKFEFDASADYKNKYAYAIDLSTTENPAEAASLSTKINASSIKAIEAKNNEFDADLTAKDKTGVFKKSALDSSVSSETNEYFATTWKYDFKDYPFTSTADNNLLLLLSASGTAYEATTNTFTAPANTAILYTVWVKTSSIGSGYTGAGISLTEKASATATADGDKTTLLSSIDSTTGTKVTVDEAGDDSLNKDDLYYGWQRCTVLVTNDTEEDKYYTLTFTYGATDENAEKTAYGAGYAAFTGFSSTVLTDKEAGYHSTGTYAAKKEFSDSDDDTASGAFDERAFGSDVTTKFADLKNYYGVESGSPMVDKNSTAEAKINDYEYAGLVNKDYAEAYKTTYASESGLAGLFDDAGALFGNVSEPAMIYNKEEGKSYGFIGRSSVSVSADSYKTVSVKVKVSAGAEASIYLIDTDERAKTAFTFNTPKVSYWYDKKGNICAKDPTSSTFKPATDTAFYLDNRGLYVPNTSWTKYDAATMNGKVYANLSNYGTDDDGNLIVADGGVSYNYDSTVWNNQGVDGIAYYAKDGKYYAYSDYTVEVTDLMTLVKADVLPPRSLNTHGAVTLEKTHIGDTQGAWKTFTFYIHTGNEAKNYRLEVWSGVRDGASANEAGSYVMFAANEMDALTADTWKSNLKQSVRNAEAKAAEAGVTDFKKSENVRYYAFSFLDSAKFLRYDSTIDVDDVGNSYTSYDSTSSDYEEGVAYLLDEDGDISRTYVDYSKTEVTVAADDSSNDSDNDNTDDTTDTSGVNGWLLASSIILAVVLLLAIVSIAVQRIAKKKNRMKAAKPAAKK